MMGQKTDFLTPVGRLVQGSPLEAQTKNMQGQPLVTMSGQPTQKYFAAVAFRKDDQAFAALYQQMVTTARASFPQLFDAQGRCTHPRFSWKLIDGDGIDDNGKPNNTKEGFAGHWVVKFQSSFAPRCFYAGRYQPHEQIQDPKAIPRGYYVRISGSMEGNDNPQKPGLYMNLNMLELVGGSPADIITSGPDAAAVFGSAGAALPPGVQPVAMASGPAVPGMPAVPPLGGAALPVAAPMQPGTPPNMPMASAPGVGMSPSSPIPAPGVAVQPHPGFLAGPGAVAGPAVGQAPGMPSPPLAPAAGAMPASPSSPAMTAKAGQYTHAQFIAQGWTDDRLRAEGYIA